MNHNISEKLFDRAVKTMPGGVNSPVRAFKSVGRKPVFIKSAKGAFLFDEDGNRYTDYIGSWGPMILGHSDERIIEAVRKQLEKGLSYGACTRLEVEMAELICSLIPFVESVRMVNSGTEAVMSAVRAARGYTGKNKIIKFEGCYHGHGDMMLVGAGSGLMTEGIPDSAGVPKGCAADTLIAEYNDIDSVNRLFDKNPGEIACIIVEPVAANMGAVPPKEGFLKALRKACDKNNAILIFDEVITGFRLSLTGACGIYGITPDLVTYGKIIGGGMPVGAYGGKREIMNVVAPAGPVYQAGTLSGNPVAMAAGLAQLSVLRENKDIYDRINSMGDYFASGLKDIIKKYALPCTVNHIGSLLTLFFTPNAVTDYKRAKTSDTGLYAKYFNFMLERGNYFAPSQFEAIFISDAHTKKDIDNTISHGEEFFKSL